MSPQSKSLHSKSSQVVDPTFGNLSLTGAGVNFRHSGKVPNRVTRKEKRTYRAYEALILSVFLLCLFLTGCSSPMVSGSSPTDSPEAVIRVGQDVSAPQSDDRAIGSSTVAEPLLETASDTAGEMNGALNAFIREEAVIERVRLISGWLKFVGQDRSAERVDVGWARLNTGQQFGELNTQGVKDQPDISIRELILWRQILRKSAEPLSYEEAERIEALAVALTVAVTPEDVAKLDTLLAPVEQYAGS